MPRRRPERLSLFLLAVLTACHPTKPAAEPGKPAPASAKPAHAASGKQQFKPDTMDAMAQLASYWTLLGVDGSAKETPTGWHRHEASGTCMPSGTPSWKLTSQRVYGPDDESVSLWNQHHRILITLFTYPARHPVDPEFDDIMQQMSRTCTEGPVMSTRVGDVHVGGCVRRLENNALLVEQALVFRQGNWFHEARITFAAAALRDAYTPAMSVFGQSFAPCPK